MAYENLCMYCFKDMGGENVCPHCGRDSRAAVPQIQLLPGTLVYRERFLIGRALGQDAGGIVYAALDTKRGGAIRIREYLPRDCAERLSDGGVVPIPGMEDAFDAGMKKLRASVESVEDPRKRHFYFEENGTAYIAQRKGASAAPAPGEGEAEEEEAARRRQIVMYIAIAAAVVLAVAAGAIWFLSSMGSTDDLTLDNPLASASAGATWMPNATPTPTPYATATFAALVDPELSWMDYTYSGDVNSEYQQQAGSAATRAPSVSTDQSYSTVSGSSSSSSIRALQQRLSALGWLSSSNISGSYDSATRQAVRDFQTYVNEYCNPAERLAVDGIAGEKTQQWLYNASVSLTKPTPTPRPPVTAAPDDGTIDANSSASEIRNVQNKLIALGLLSEGGADGRYGSATATAVRNFQIRVNQLQGYQALEISGTVDPDTMAYLNYYVEWWQQQQAATATPAPATASPTPALPTSTPVPQATATQSGAVDASSSREEIAKVQEMLERVGLLGQNDVDGVYGSGTAEAVRAFQSWVNQQRGEDTLSVSGSVDALTRAYLEYCVENGLVASLPTSAPTAEPTAEPTGVPTAEPTEVPPSQQAGEGVSPDSPVESITFVQEMLADIGLLDASDIDGNYGEATREAISILQNFVNEQQGEQVLEVSGICDRLTLEYLQYCYDHGWNLSDRGDEPEATEAPDGGNEGGVDASSSAESVTFVQEMLADVGLLDPSDIDGNYGEATSEAVRALQNFVNERQGERVLEVSGVCDALTLRYLQYCYDEGWNLADRGDEPDATEVPVTEAPATEVPATEAPTEVPVAEIGAFSLYVNGQETADGSLELDAGSYELRWQAEGGVQGYYLYLFDAQHNLLRSAENVDTTGFVLDTSAMNPGEVYELRIGALPAGGGQDDVLWRTLQLTLRAQATAEPTAEPTPEPTAVPGVDAPSINIGASVYQSDGVTYINDTTVIFSWMASGAVESYTVDLIYQDGSVYSLGTTNDTSRTVNRDQLQPGLYILRVQANGLGGESAQSELRFGVPEPAATEAPTPEPTEPPQQEEARLSYVDASSDPAEIRTVQVALYGYGLLDTDNAQEGVLDQTTLEAVAAFQLRVNELYGAGLSVIDPSSGGASIDAATLDYLLYQNSGLE